MRKFLVVSLICLTALVTGSCNRNSGAADTSAGGQQTLSYWMPFVANASTLMKSWDDNVVWQHKEKVTGVKVNFISPAIGDETVAFNLLLSSNDLPDLIQIHSGGFSYGYPGGPSKAVADGVFLRLNELIAKNAPNFTRVIDSNPDFKRQVMTDDGLLWGMGMLETVAQTNPWGPTIREDWLQDLGLAAPVTVADWRNVLTQFKQKKGAVAPWVMGGSGLAPCFVWAYDISDGGWLQRDNKVVYSFTDPGFLEYLTEMNRWYKEGLIPQDFQSGELNSMLTDGVSGAYQQGFWMFAIDQNMIREKDPKAVIGPVAIPVKAAGSTTKLRDIQTNNRGMETVVTSSCKDPDMAVKWLDWNYSDEGYYWNNFGEEGFSYNMVNGEPVWTDFMTKNPDGFDLNFLMNKYSMQMGSYVRDWQAIFVAYPPAANLTLTLWDGDSSHKLQTGLLSFTADEGSTNASIMSDINTYVSEMTVKFITGQEPLGNWNTYVRNINNMGIADVLKNYQTAYDRYLNRK
ncbi:sugar ABC transporter permease [Spirochaetia bacterium]|nr:sugar ABC transporter permease [Spirochaetia bacterium]